MRKGTIATFFIISIVMGLVGAGLIIAGLVGSTFSSSTNGFPSGHLVSFGNLPLFITGVVIAALSGIPYLVAWIGALVSTARMQQWVWFVIVFFFHWIALLIYLIAAPGITRAYQQYPQYPQYQQYPQYRPREDPPPQPPNYPRS